MNKNISIIQNENDNENNINVKINCLNCTSYENYNIISNSLNEETIQYLIKTKLIINSRYIRPKFKTTEKKIKWTLYHYEILNKCLKIFGNDIEKILIFIYGFTANHIKRRIRLLNKMNKLKKEIEVNIKLKEKSKYLCDDLLDTNKFEKMIPISNNVNFIKEMDSNIDQFFFKSLINCDKIFDNVNSLKLTT